MKRKLLICLACLIFSGPLSGMPQGLYRFRLPVSDSGPASKVRASVVFAFGKTWIKKMKASSVRPQSGKRAASILVPPQQEVNARIRVFAREEAIRKDVPASVFRDTGYIRGLVWKNGEYLYGQIRLPGLSRQYRCKLWEKKGQLYLRIYGPYNWHTWRLQRVLSIKNPLRSKTDA